MTSPLSKRAFDDDWNSDNTPAGNGDDLVWSPGSESALLSLINNAQVSLDIYNEEMADANITDALEDAARRGVAVRVDMTYSSEWKTAFAALTAVGVQVRTYAVQAPFVYTCESRRRRRHEGFHRQREFLFRLALQQPRAWHHRERCRDDVICREHLRQGLGRCCAVQPMILRI